MNDYISRQAAIDAVNGMPDCPNGYSDTYDKAHIISVLEDVPSVQPQKNDETCDSCRYRYKEWDEDPCDGCTPADSGYCPDSIELQPPISKREWYQKGYEAGLKSVQPQRWIPCSETVDIPEYSVLACDKYGEYIIGFLCYEDDQWLCESEHEYMYDAVAWMPLPPSYKGGQE